MKYNLIFFALLIIISSSCQQKTTSTDTRDNEVKDTTSVEKVYPGQQKMEEINNRVTELEEVHSLYWEKYNEDQATFTEVIAYLNEDGVPVKMIEQYSNGSFQDQGSRYYYLEDSKIVAFEEKKDSWLDSNTFIYEEIQTFYNEQEPVSTRKRTSQSVNDIESSSWETVRPEPHTLTKVNKILSGSEEFETHFISVIEAQSGLFLLLGEPKEKDRYQTAVRVDEKTPFIEDLLSNLEAYKFRPIQIQFMIEGGNGSPQFQVLTDAKWKDE